MKRKFIVYGLLLPVSYSSHNSTVYHTVLLIEAQTMNALGEATCWVSHL